MTSELDTTTTTTVAGVEHRFAELGDVRLHYLDAGAGELVVLLHGFPQYCGAWHAQIDVLKRRRRVVAPDLRGYNRSSKPPRVADYRMRHLVEDVRRLVQDELAAERFTLVGHDWGGAISWAFALQHPDLLDRLVVMNAPPPFTWPRAIPTAAQQEASAYMLDFEGEDAPERLAADDFAWLERLLLSSGDEWYDAATRRAYHEAWSQPGALRATIGYYLAAGMPDQVRAGKAPEHFARWAESASIATPTLVVWGEHERYLVPEMRAGLERWVPNLRLEVVPGAGHWIAQERPDEVNRLLVEFLDG